MTWFDTPLTEDQLEVVELGRSLLPSLPDPEGDHAGTETVPVESVDRAAEARAGAVESGLWSIGMSEEAGGGGAPLDLRQVALVALGGEQPALAWSVVQAHAAAEVLALAADEAGLGELLAATVEGGQSACIVDAADPQVRLDAATGLAGGIGRLDPGGEAPLVVVLDGPGAAWVLAPDAITPSAVRRRTGLAGALTVSAEVTGPAVRVTGIDADAIRARLQLGGAAIAAGIAVAAAEAALAYSRERIQFGAPLTGLPTVRASLAEQAASAAAAVEVALTVGARPPARAAAVLRDNCERGIAVAAAAVQSLGGYGYLREYGVERMLRDAVSLRAATGAAQGMRRVADTLAPA